jgi:AcrR family transcriptional regulator
MLMIFTLAHFNAKMLDVTNGSSAVPYPAGLARRTRYHHGNLVEELQRGVLELVAERGVAGVTMAEAARRAGVSAAAPYRHYGSLDELLLATAEGCYANWMALRANHPDGRGRGEAGIMALLTDFFDFARDEPAAFVLLFDSGNPKLSGTVSFWTEDGYRDLVTMVSEATSLPATRCGGTALGITACVLGHARLAVGGLTGMTMDAAASQAASTVRTLLAGFQSLAFTADQE